MWDPRTDDCPYVSTRFTSLLLGRSSLNQTCIRFHQRRQMLSKFTLGILGVGLLAVLSLGFAGYSATNLHTMTVTGQQYVTNTQMETTTVTAVSVVYSPATQTQTVSSSATQPSGAAYQLNCGSGSSSYGCNWPYTYDACQGTGQGNNVACDGYLLQGPNGCVELAVPTDTVEQPAYDHYALQNLPSSYPSIGSWVVVKGALSLSASPNSASNSSACPANSISVTSIQPTNPPPSP